MKPSSATRMTMMSRSEVANVVIARLRLGGGRITLNRSSCPERDAYAKACTMHGHIGSLTKLEAFDLIRCAIGLLSLRAIRQYTTLIALQIGGLVVRKMLWEDYCRESTFVR